MRLGGWYVREARCGLPNMEKAREANLPGLQRLCVVRVVRRLHAVPVFTHDAAVAGTESGATTAHVCEQQEHRHQL